MRVLIGTLLLVMVVSSAFAQTTLYSGTIRSVNDGKLVLVGDRGYERSLRVTKETICFINGRETKCSKIHPESKARIDVLENGICYRIVIDQAPQ
jgi:hypothetical protein